MERFAPALRGNFHGALHRAGVAGNHGLLGRIEVCWRADFAFRRALAGIQHHRRRNTHDHGHAALSRGHGFLHILSALVHQAHHIRKVQRANCHERRILAQAVPGDKVWRQTLLRHHAYLATDTVRMAGCVFAVSFNSSSLPSKHILEMEKPSALSASSKTARAVQGWRLDEFEAMVEAITAETPALEGAG